MLKACCLIRAEPHYRREAFEQGLKRAGYREAGPNDCDVLVIWNRYGHWARAADKVEARGGRVLVAENGYLGNDFCGDRWYAISEGQHNGAGRWPDGGPERWDRLDVPLVEWRTGKEVIVLPQRGIGPPGVAMPDRWAEGLKMRKGWRLRAHPGVADCEPLANDLGNARAVVTWGSGAALKALLWGIPAFYAMPKWIGAAAATPLDQADWSSPQTPARLPMFRRLAWAMWRLSEIESGEAFRWLLPPAK